MKVVKLVLCGQGGVGKSSLASAFVGEEFKKHMTIGADFYFKVVSGVKTVIWDLGGEERFRFMAPPALKGAHGVLYVFDLTRPSTLDALCDWFSLAKEVLGDHSAALIGNKADLPRKVDREAAEKFARERGMLFYMETSALTGAGVNEAFTRLIEAASKKSDP